MNALDAALKEVDGAQKQSIKAAEECEKRVADTAAQLSASL